MCTATSTTTSRCARVLVLLLFSLLPRLPVSTASRCRFCRSTHIFSGAASNYGPPRSQVKAVAALFAEQAQGVPSAEVTVEVVHGGAHSAAAAVATTWLPFNCADRRRLFSAHTPHFLSAGITNKLKKVGYPAGAPAVLVRLFGAEGMIDRTEEDPIFQAICNALGEPR